MTATTTTLTTAQVVEDSHKRVRRSEVWIERHKERIAFIEGYANRIGKELEYVASIRAKDQRAGG